MFSSSMIVPRKLRTCTHLICAGTLTEVRQASVSQLDLHLWAPINKTKMKIQQENIREYPKICEIREHFLSWTIPVIRYALLGSQTDSLQCFQLYRAKKSPLGKPDLEVYVKLPHPVFNLEKATPSFQLGKETFFQAKACSVGAHKFSLSFVFVLYLPL